MVPAIPRLLAVRRLLVICLSLLTVFLVGCSSSGSSPASVSSTTTPGASGPSGSGVPGSSGGSTLSVGVAAVDITPPVGVPLGGYGDGDRRRSFPDLDPTDYHTLMSPSTGILDPIMCKALVLEESGRRFAIMTIDAVAVTAQAVADLHRIAAARGVDIPLDHIMAVASHTHSGPGTITDLHFWEFAAMDFYQSQVYDGFVNGCADALVAAWNDRGPATFAAGSTAVVGLTRNRRARDSNVFTRDSIDSELGVMRFDRLDGTPVATLWNFPVHGLIYWWDNMEYSADLFGHVARRVEAQGGGICLYANGAEGDLVPNGRGAADGDRLGGTLSNEILAVRASLTPTGSVNLAGRSEWIDFGAASLSIDVNRLGRSNSGSRVVQLLQGIPGFSLGIGISMGSSWFEHRHRFSGLRINDVAVATIPGEAIHTVGLAVKSHGSSLGYRQTFVFGLANSHMGYITTPDEYDAGGYESLSTFFGRDTGDRVTDTCNQLLNVIR